MPNCCYMYAAMPYTYSDSFCHPFLTGHEPVADARKLLDFTKQLTFRRTLMKKTMTDPRVAKRIDNLLLLLLTYFLLFVGLFLRWIYILMFGTIVEIGRIIKPMHSYRVTNFPPAFQPEIPRNIITEVR